MTQARSLAMLAACAVMACSGMTDSAPIAASIAISPGGKSMARGETARLAAQVKTGDGTPIEAVVTWISSSPGVVRVSPSGDIEAMSAGTAQVTATYRNLSAATAITVVDPDARIATSISLSASLATLWIGESLTIQSLVRNKWGEVIPGAEVIWTIDNPAVVRRDPDGSLLALAEGRADVVATSGRLQSALTITVTKPGGLRVEGPTQMISGSEGALVATRIDRLGAREALAGVWTSDDERIASVTADGKVTALVNGETTLRGVTKYGAVSAPLIVQPLTGMVAFLRGTSTIMLMALDGSPPVALKTDDPPRGTLALSPDGKRIAFDCLTGVCSSVLGSGVAHQFAQGAFPSWSADGSRVAVLGPSRTVRVYDAAGLLVASQFLSGYYVDRPRLAASGKSIVFECDYTNPYDIPEDLCTVAVGTNGNGTLIQPGAIHAALALDGNQLAYMPVNQSCSGLGINQSCVGSAATCHGGATEPAWSPDARFVVFVRQTELWISNVAGTNCFRLARATGGGFGAASPSWSVGAPPR